MLFQQGNRLNGFNFFNVKNNLLKTTNPKCIRENPTLDSPFTADEVSKGIAQ